MLLKKSLWLTTLIVAQLSAANFDSVKVSKSGSHYLMDIDGSLSGNILLYIDSDNNKNTGYTSGSFKGADYKIELSDVSKRGNASARKYQNRLYKYQGSSSAPWNNWKKQSRVPSINVGHGFIDMNFAGLSLKESSRYTVMMTTKSSWNKIVTTKSVQKTSGSSSAKPASKSSHTSSSTASSSTSGSIMQVSKGGYENLVIYVNSDNSNSGYSDRYVKGADYKIELSHVGTKTGGRQYKNSIHKYQGNSSKSWENWHEIYNEDLDRSDLINVTSSTIKVNVPKVLGSRAKSNMKMTAVKMNSSWRVLGKIGTTATSSSSHVATKVTAKPAPKPKPKPVTSSSSSSAKVITFSKGGYEHVQVFFNTDNNTNTGYKTFDIKGADYMLELARVNQKTGNRQYVTDLFKYQGSAQDNWNNFKETKGRTLDSASIINVTSSSISINLKNLLGSSIANKSIPYYIEKKNSSWKAIAIASAGIWSPSGVTKVAKKTTTTVAKKPTRYTGAFNYRNVSPYVPSLDFDSDDVYDNGRVKRGTMAQIQNWLYEPVAPKTTYIVKRSGDDRNFNIKIPANVHDITIKGNGLTITPRGRENESAFYIKKYNTYRRETKTMVAHHINIVDFNVVGKSSQKTIFVRGESGAYYGAHHIYIKDVKMKGLWEGVFSPLHSHDWTMDNCEVFEFGRFKETHAWYMLGWHLAVINSHFHKGTHDMLTIRGSYPEGEKYYDVWASEGSSEYYQQLQTNREKNVWVKSRTSGLLDKNIWTHLIKDNDFGSWATNNSGYSGERSQTTIAYRYYDDNIASDGRPYKKSEWVYLPPQNVVIDGNSFDNSNTHYSFRLAAVGIDVGNGVRNVVTDNNRNFNSYGGGTTSSPNKATVKGIFIINNELVKKSGGGSRQGIAY